MTPDIETGVFSLIIHSLIRPNGTKDHQIHAANKGVDPEVLIMHLKGFLRSEEDAFFKRFANESNKDSA